VTTDNVVSKEIQARLKASNVFYYVLHAALKSQRISRKVKLNIYIYTYIYTHITILRQIVTYACETWVGLVTRKDELTNLYARERF
jgi:hypothetical protein